MRRVCPVVLLAVGGCFVAVDVGLLLAFGRAGTEYGLRFGVDLYILQIITVLAFLAGGYAAFRLRPGNATGVLMVWLGVVAAVNDSAGYLLVTTAWPVVVLRTVAVLFVPVQWAVAIHIVLAYPTGSLRDRTAAATVRACYAAALFGPAVSLLGRHAPLCGRCPAALGLGLISTTMARRLETADLALWAALIAAGLVVFARRFGQASGRERRILAYPAGAVAVGAVVVVAFLVQVVLARGFGIRLQLPLADAMEVTAALVLPAGFLLGLLRERFEEARVSDLVRQLAVTPPQELSPVLARALGDPGARLVYAADSGYLDQAGRRVEPAGHQRLTPVGNPGQPVAFLLHDRILDLQPQLVDAVGNAVALALDNARLHAEVLAQLAAVDASRARIVESADNARRKLERDLHDGAQQRLVSLGLGLRVVRERLAGADPVTLALLDETGQQATSAVAELRDLARGIHPATLTQQGIAAAVEQLTLRCPIPVRRHIADLDRLSASIEATAYFVVSEALANVVKHAQATAAAVTIDCADGRLRVRVTDDGTGGAAAVPGGGLSGLADRVAAVAGSLTIGDLPDGGTSVAADLPCTPA